MRAEAEGVVFLLLHFDPVRDEVGIEDVAFEQERMIGFERFNRAAERIGNARHVGEFFRRELVKVFVQRVARIDPALDSIESGQEECGEGDVRIRRGVRCAEFDPFRFGIGRVGRNADGGGTVAKSGSRLDDLY